MDCSKFNQYLFEYFVNHELDWKIKYEMEEHSFECEECRNNFEFFQRLYKSNAFNDLQKDFIESKLIEANDFKKYKKFDEALGCLQDILIVNQSRPEIEAIQLIIDIGDRCLAKGLLDNSLKAFNLLNKYYPDNKDFISRLAYIYFLMKEYHKSIEYSQMVLQIDPDNTEVMNLLGVVYMKRGLFNEAINYLEKANDLINDKANANANVNDNEDDNDNRNISILCNLGESYLRTKQFYKAMFVLEKADQINPKDANIINNLALAYFNLDKIKESVGLLETAEAILPKDSNILTNLGISYIADKDYMKAVKTLERANAISEGNFYTISHLALVYSHTGHTQKSLEIYRILLETYPEDASLNNNIAVCFFSSGDSYNAKHYIEVAYRIEPSNEMIFMNKDIIFGFMQGECFLFGHGQIVLSVH